MPVYATWDPNNTTDSAAAFSNSNRTYIAQGSGRFAHATLGTATVPKYYFEVEKIGACNGTYDRTGVALVSSYDRWTYTCLGHVYANGSYPYTSQGGYVAGDVIGFAVEDIGSQVKLWIRRADGTWINDGDPAAGTSPTLTINTTTEITPLIRGGYLHGGTINCGQEAYTHTPPAGFADLAIADIIQFEDLALDLSYIHDHLEDIKTPLQLAALVVESLPAELRLALSSLEGDLPLAARLCAQWRRSLPLEIRLDSGEVLADMAARLALTDGTALASLPVRALLTRMAPLYQAVIAQRLRSVKHA